MNCQKCGTPLRGTEQFCRNCGTPVNRNYQAEINNGLNNQYPNNSGFDRYNMNNNYNMNYNNKYNNEPKTNKVKYFIIGFLSAIGVFILLLLIIGIFAEDDSEENNKLNDQPNVVMPDDFKEDDTAYKVDYQGFTFSIPSSLSYEIEDDDLFISDEYKKWGVYVSVGEGTYSKMLNNKDYLPSFYQEKGFITSDAFERTIDGTQFITMEFTYNNYNGIIAYTAASSMHIFGLTVYSYDNDYDYSIIEEINEILKSAEYNSQDDNISVFNGLTLSVISQLGK